MTAAKNLYSGAAVTHIFQKAIFRHVMAEGGLCHYDVKQAIAGEGKEL